MTRPHRNVHFDGSFDGQKNAHRRLLSGVRCAIAVSMGSRWQIVQRRRYPPVNRGGDLRLGLRRVLVATRPPHIGRASALASIDTCANPDGRAAPRRPRPAGRRAGRGDGGRWTLWCTGRDAGSACCCERTLRPGSPPRVGGFLTPTRRPAATRRGWVTGTRTVAPGGLVGWDVHPCGVRAGGGLFCLRVGAAGQWRRDPPFNLYHPAFAWCSRHYRRCLCADVGPFRRRSAHLRRSLAARDSGEGREPPPGLPVGACHDQPGTRRWRLACVPRTPRRCGASASALPLARLGVGRGRLTWRRPLLPARTRRHRRLTQWPVVPVSCGRIHCRTCMRPRGRGQTRRLRRCWWLARR